MRCRLPAFINWWLLDPWLSVRMAFHGWHSHSPLSHPFLLKRAFFSKEYPENKLANFQSHMSRYESLPWSLGSMFHFVDPKRVLRKIEGWGVSNRVLIMAGAEEELMTKPIQEKEAETYRAAFSELVRKRTIGARDDAIHNLAGEGGLDNVGHGVELAWVPGSAHHLQNDTTWEIGAEKLLAFLHRL